jgi:hypothetical protein
MGRHTGATEDAGMRRFAAGRVGRASGGDHFQPAGAGAVLAATAGLTTGIGALVGWAVGSVGVGVAAGAAIGIPAGVFAVYRRYRGYFTG